MLNLRLYIFNKNFYFRLFNYTFSTLSILVFCFKKKGIQKERQEEQAVKLLIVVEILILSYFLSSTEFGLLV